MESKFNILVLVAPLGGLKTRMESSATKDTPSQINKVLRVLFHLPYDLSSSASASFLIFGLCTYYCFCLSYIFGPDRSCSHSMITLLKTLPCNYERPLA